MHGHTNMLTTVLKGELGFEGFLISDWAGVDQIAPNYSDAVVNSVNAGMDMVMVPHQYQNFLSILKAAVLTGDVSTNRIDDAVRRILTVKFEAGLFENPYAQRQLLADVVHDDVHPRCRHQTRAGTRRLDSPAECGCARCRQ